MLVLNMGFKTDDERGDVPPETPGSVLRQVVTGEEAENGMSEDSIDEGEKHCDADVTGKSLESEEARKAGEDEVEEDGDSGYC